ncbi:hypothetical protein FRB93_001241 [Tulasnella sp. JGI-2019a]|nr:hypothetical protein FRB93_001241 [Tulasnella sp. JGI-2019a]
MAAGFGKNDRWITGRVPPPGHLLTCRQALHGVVDNLIIRASLPPWVWGSQASRASLEVAGIAGRGWLGKRVQHTAVAFSELGGYMREMLQDELAGVSDCATGQERSNLFKNLVEGLGSKTEGVALSEGDVFGNMFIFLITGFETTAHAVAYALGLLALDEVEQQQLYDHIKQVLQDQEPTFDDVPRLTRVLAVFLETVRLYPATTETTKYVEEDAVFSVPAALSELEALELDETDERRTDVFMPKGSEVILDLFAVSHNPRYWSDPYTFKPERFLEPNWPRDAFTSFAIGSRSCIGRRFAEVEAIAIITLIVREYKVSIDPARFPDIPGESKLQRRERVLKSAMNLVVRPCDGIPLVLTRRS